MLVAIVVAVAAVVYKWQRNLSCCRRGRAAELQSRTCASSLVIVVLVRVLVVVC